MTNEATKLLLFAKNIKKFRKENGLSQNELAEILDISREHLAKIETAKRCMSLKLIFKFCEKLNISTKDLFTF